MRNTLDVPQGRMARKRHFVLGIEDAHLDTLAAFGCSVSRKYERGFIQLGFTRQRQHLCIGKTTRIGEYD
jgi:hypothetical protein